MDGSPRSHSEKNLTPRDEPRTDRLIARANADIVAAYEHYENLVPGLGVDFVRRLDAALIVVSHSPQLFRKRHRAVRLAMTERFPYAIYFVWDEPSDFISIRRVLHFAQNAPAHLAK